MDGVTVSLAAVSPVAKRHILERLNTLRMMLIGGLALPGEMHEFVAIATTVADDAKRLDPTFQSKRLSDLLAGLRTVRNPDMALANGRAWVDGMASLLDEHATEGNLFKPVLARPPLSMVAGIIVVLIAIAGSVWYSHYFTDTVIFPNRPQRLSDLSNVADALERYHAAKGAYPVSANNGGDWNGRLWGADEQNWIPGLAPDFIATLPGDPRNAVTKYMQYVYKSDGKDYKLLSLFPEDCAATVAEHKEMADPARNKHRCAAYGKWTAGATEW